MILLLFSLLKIVLNTRMELDYHPLKKYLFIFWPFAIYSGWVSIALIANVAAWLTKIGWSGWGLSEVTWTLILICIAGLINIYMVWKRNLREYALVGIWGLVAVAVANDGTSILRYSCFAVSLLVLVVVMLHGIKNLQRSVGRM